MAQTLDRGNCGIARFRGKEATGQSSAPRRGSAIIAQGKAAEAAALGERPPSDTQPPLFPRLAPPAAPGGATPPPRVRPSAFWRRPRRGRGGREKREKGGGVYIAPVTQGGARS